MSTYFAFREKIAQQMLKIEADCFLMWRETQWCNRVSDGGPGPRLCCVAAGAARLAPWAQLPEGARCSGTGTAGRVWRAGRLSYVRWNVRVCSRLSLLGVLVRGARRCPVLLAGLPLHTGDRSTWLLLTCIFALWKSPKYCRYPPS